MEMEIRQQIKAIREEKKIKQAQLADKVDISRVTLGRFERGQTDISFQKVQDICAALGLKLELVKID